MLNVNQVTKNIREQNGGTTYTYTKVSNLLAGFKGSATTREIQQLRKVIKAELMRIDNLLSKLERE